MKQKTPPVTLRRERGEADAYIRARENQFLAGFYQRASIVKKQQGAACAEQDLPSPPSHQALPQRNKSTSAWGHSIRPYKQKLILFQWGSSWNQGFLNPNSVYCTSSSLCSQNPGPQPRDRQHHLRAVLHPKDPWFQASHIVQHCACFHSLSLSFSGRGE